MSNNTPILYITFARSEYARKTFDAIKLAKPKKLYFYSNRARINNIEEIRNNNEIRSYIDEIDWPCKLETFFRDEYVDIYTSLFSAIDWIFEKNERAIIIEEDCLASLTFFHFCEELLDKYETNEKVWMISGDNYHDNKKFTEKSYFFSRNMHIYGWASWRSRWKKIARNGNWSLINQENLLSNYFQNEKQTIFHKNRFESFMKNINGNPAWDYIFFLAMIENISYAVVPAKNLVEDIGTRGVHSNFGLLGYHKISKDHKSLSNINHPIFVIPNNKFDSYHFKNHWAKQRTIQFRIMSSLYRLLKNLYKQIL